jgi:hypothetical protein
MQVGPHSPTVKNKTRAKSAAGFFYSIGCCRCVGVDVRDSVSVVSPGKPRLCACGMVARRLHWLGCPHSLIETKPDLPARTLKYPHPSGYTLERNFARV